MQKDQNCATRLKITERALYQRVNRKLKQGGEQLRTARSQRVEMDLGRYFIVNFYHNFIAAQHDDVEALAREIGVIRPWEQVAA